MKRYEPDDVRWWLAESQARDVMDELDEAARATWLRVPSVILLHWMADRGFGVDEFEPLTSIYLERIKSDEKSRMTEKACRSRGVSFILDQALPGIAFPVEEVRSVFPWDDVVRIAQPHAEAYRKNFDGAAPRAMAIPGTGWRGTAVGWNHLLLKGEVGDHVWEAIIQPSAVGGHDHLVVASSEEGLEDESSGLSAMIEHQTKYERWPDYNTFRRSQAHQWNLGEAWAAVGKSLADWIGMRGRGNASHSRSDSRKAEPTSVLMERK